jgi:hypothetical protein
MVYKADGVDQVIQPSIPGIVPITFDRVLYDTCGCWDEARNRFVVPAGARFVRLSAQAIFTYPKSQPKAPGVRQIVIKKNMDAAAKPTDFYDKDRSGWAVGQVTTHIATTADVQATGPVLLVVPGDTFIVDAFQSDGADSVPAAIRGTNGTWFAIEIIE